MIEDEKQGVTVRRYQIEQTVLLHFDPATEIGITLQQCPLWQETSTRVFAPRGSILVQSTNSKREKVLFWSQKVSRSSYFFCSDLQKIQKKRETPFPS